MPAARSRGVPSTSTSGTQSRPSLTNEAAPRLAAGDPGIKRRSAPTPEPVQNADSGEATQPATTQPVTPLPSAPRVVRLPASPDDNSRDSSAMSPPLAADARSP